MISRARDCASSISDAATCLWNCAARPAAFICELEENLESLRSKISELNSISEGVRTRIRLAEQQHKHPKPEVNHWLETVRNMNLEVNEILQSGDQAIQQRCLGSQCPKNFRTTYKIQKKVVKTLGIVSGVAERGRNLDDEANDLPHPLVDEMPMEKIVGLDSIFDDTWRCINNEHIGIIGLWGPRGVGKSTLLKKINKEFAKQCHDIDKVVWVVVSKDGIAENVQNDIGRELGLPNDTWDEMNGDQKASVIQSALSGKRFVLLLDDMLKRIDVGSLGVPYPNSENRSKIIFTSRSEEVCVHMEAQKIIKVECLSPSQALELFRETVGDDTLNSHPQLPQFAESIAKECDGLPLALITIGRAMAYKKTVREWEYALRMLRECRLEISGMDDLAFSTLRSSYDSLPNENIKSCFLYCCIFPEDYDIPIQGLVGLWIGEGFLNDSKNTDEALNKGNEIIANLQHVLLLESGKNANFVKLPSASRDMALMIARKEKTYIFPIVGMTINNSQMIEWEKAKHISMWNVNSIDSNCSRTYPNLSTLLVSRDRCRNDPFTFPRGFFQCIPVVKVLDFENSGLEHVPMEIGNLVSLQYLSFSWTSIKRLPMELKNLKNLRYLHLERISNLLLVPREVISGLLMLQVLNLKGTDMNIVGHNLSGHKKSLLEELECLQHLDYATLVITTVHDVRTLQNSHKLQRIMRAVEFKLCEGLTSLSFSSFRSMSCLKEVSFDRCDSLQELTFNQNEQKREEIDNIPNLNFSSYPQCLKNLHQVTISYCARLKNMTWLIHAPNVKVLHIGGCDSMEEVISESYNGVIGLQNDRDIFSSLEMLVLSGLTELGSIYKNVLPFPCLEDMRVIGCPKLKKLPFDSQSAKNSFKTLRIEKEWWDTLEWEVSTTRDAFLRYVSFIGE